MGVGLASLSPLVRAHSCALPAQPKLSDMPRSTGFIETAAPNNPPLVMDGRDSRDDRRHLGVRDIPITAETVWARAMSGATAELARQNDAQRRASFQ
jgi:hypothetical protein